MPIPIGLVAYPKLVDYAAKRSIYANDPTAHALLVGNGSGSLLTLLPSTARNVAISDGTDWGSRALQAADLPNLSGVYQPLSANLTTIAALTEVDGKFLVGRAGAWTNDVLLSADLTTPLLTPPAIGTTTPAAGKFTTLQATGNFTLSGAPGKILPAANSTTALQIAQADGTAWISFDTTNKRIGFNGAAPLLFKFGFFGEASVDTLLIRNDATPAQFAVFQDSSLRSLFTVNQFGVLSLRVSSGNGGRAMLVISDDPGTQRFTIFDSGTMNLNASPATSGVQTQSSPGVVLTSTYWNGSASVSENFSFKITRLSTAVGHAVWEIRDKDNVVTFGIAGLGGQVAVGYAFPSSGALATLGQFHVRILATTTPGITVQGIANQTANLQQWQNSTPTALGSISAIGVAQHIPLDAATNTITNVLLLDHSSSGTPAANYGTGLLISGQSDTTLSRAMVRLRTLWTTVTDASRKARGVLSAYDTAERDCIEWEASGTVPMVAFFGTAPIVKPTALTTALTTITFTAPGTPDYAIQDFTQTVPWGFASQNEANTVLSVIANLQARVNGLETKLQSLGLLT